MELCAEAATNAQAARSRQPWPGRLSVIFRINPTASVVRRSKRIMGVAFEIAHAAVERDWGDYADATIAKRIIELAKGGERNLDVLCEQALKGLRW
jgi:hypothetical protein